MNISKIDSQKHPAVQLLREIQSEKGREQHKAFHVEGTMVVRRALEYGQNVRFIVCTDKFVSSTEASEILTAAEQSGVDVFQVSEGLMAKAAPGKPAAVVVAVVERRLWEPSVFLDGRNPLLILVDRCENPDNLGMLLRSLDAAGVDGVLMTSDSVDPFNRLSVRASRGSVLSLRMAIVANPEDFIKQARNRGFLIAASSARGEKVIWDADFRGASMIVVGNEHTGVRPSIRELADCLICIPMAGKMESLNIAAAGTIIAYEAARQRKELTQKPPSVPP